MKRLRTLAEFLAVLIVGLGLIEAGLRIWKPLGAEFDLKRQWGDTPGDLHKGAPDRKVALAPNKTAHIDGVEFHTTVRTNAVGLRGPELGPKGDALRLLTLGDSFVLGVQVDLKDTFQHQLSLKLTEQLGRTVDVLNGGVDSYGTHQSTLQMLALTPEIEPDAVLVGLTLPNDLDDNLRFAAQRRSRRARGLEPHQAPGPNAKRLYGFSYLASFLHLHWSMRQVKRHPAVIAQQQRHRQLQTDPAVLEQHRSGTVRALRTLSAKCEALALPCFVTLIPGRDSVASGAPDPLAQAVLEWMPKSLTAWDLTPALQAAPQDPPLYFRYDQHWAPAGHAVAATALAQNLEPQLTQPPDAPNHPLSD